MSDNCLYLPTNTFPIVVSVRVSVCKVGMGELGFTDDETTLVTTDVGDDEGVTTISSAADVS